MRAALLFLCGLLISVTSYALKPSKDYYAVPDTLKLPYEKNTITTPDNVKLQSWTFLPAKEQDNHTCVVMAYADAGNMSHWLTQSPLLSQLGFTVVMFDYRGFGHSAAFTINPKMLYYNEFVTDLTAVFRFAKNKYKAKSTGIWCFSMGTIITTLAEKDAKPDFIIGDGFVTSPDKIKAFYAKKNDKIDLPPGAERYTTALKDIKVPMLIFSGSRDNITKDAEVLALKKTKPNLKVITFDGSHLQGFTVLTKDYPGSEYIADMKAFLKLK